MYKYTRFVTNESARAGQALVDFLNDNPSIKVVKIEFTNIEFDSDSGRRINNEIAHLIYDDAPSTSKISG